MYCPVHILLTMIRSGACCDIVDCTVKVQREGICTTETYGAVKLESDCFGGWFLTKPVFVNSLDTAPHSTAREHGL